MFKPLTFTFGMQHHEVENGNRQIAKHITAW